MDLGYRGRGRGVGRERVVRSERQMAVTSGHFAPVLHLETCLRGGGGWERQMAVHSAPVLKVHNLLKHV